MSSYKEERPIEKGDKPYYFSAKGKGYSGATIVAVPDSNSPGARFSSGICIEVYDYESKNSNRVGLTREDVCDLIEELNRWVVDGIEWEEKNNG